MTADRVTADRAGELNIDLEHIWDAEPSLNGSAAADSSEPGSALFRRWTVDELIRAKQPLRWLAKGLWVAGSYGQVGGEAKSLKSYVETFINVSIAGGVPVFGKFAVTEPSPVVCYVGEGGRLPFTGRLERIARAAGVDLAGLPIYPSFDTAPIHSLTFQESLARDLAEIQPGKVTIDPLYAFHGPKTDARNLHEEGALLNAVSRPCIEAGTALSIVNHFNQTGSGSDLSRITLSGAAEWSDSWILLSHRHPPDVPNGNFRLLMKIGSRQWGGSEWDLDLELGTFDIELGDFTGDITWTVARHEPAADTNEDDRLTTTEDRICEILADRPYALTKTEVLKDLGGNRDRAHRAFRSLVDKQHIVYEDRIRPESGVNKRRPVWALSHEPVPANGPGWSTLAAEQ